MNEIVRHRPSQPLQRYKMQEFCNSTLQNGRVMTVF